MMNLFILVGSLFLFWSADANGHSGGLDSNGCHGGSQPYHCHRSASEMVGNRLRCDLGSRSKECNKNNHNVNASGLPKNMNAGNGSDSVTSNNLLKTATSKARDLSDWKRDFSDSSGDVRLKNARCRQGIWHVDMLNRGTKSVLIGYVFWIEDKDGDSLGSETGVEGLKGKGRKIVSTGVSCDLDFERIKMDIDP